METIPDIFQQRYVVHQKRKKYWIENQTPIAHYNWSENDIKSLKEIIKRRRSRRIYSGVKITDDEMKQILECANFAPSSCNRKAIELIDANENIEYLVGGKNWIDKADRVLMVYANMLAYKSPNEVDFMPYLDTGFVAQNVYLICEVLNINCCFVNPNSYDINLDKEGKKFCGAIALGK